MSTLTLPTRTDGTAHYSFDVLLDGAKFYFDLRWNARDGAWYMSISDRDRAPIVSGVRVVTNWPLLRRCVDPRRPAGTIIAIDSTEEGDPGLTDLGGRVVLTYTEAA
jgi:hypothetical protein